MKSRVIIWNFSCTIYNPATDALIPGARDLVKETKKCGYINILYSKNLGDDLLVSRKIRQLKIAKYFKELVVRKRADIKDLYAVLSKYNADFFYSFLISNWVRTDIKMGNLLGLKTIWLRAGQLAPEWPRTLEEEPLTTVTSLAEMKGWFKKI